VIASRVRDTGNWGFGQRDDQIAEGQWRRRLKAKEVEDVAIKRGSSSLLNTDVLPATLLIQTLSRHDVCLCNAPAKQGTARR
jgi:hypothetical protein